MIITRTPFRISFVGGGTDYPAWYRENPGAVLATTIDKYCYLSVRYLPPFFEHKHRIVYSKMEEAESVEEIRHPSVRETMKFMGITEETEGLEIHHDADLPARSGVGSSSSFTVGLLHALHALKGAMVTEMQLAMEAIHIEQDMIEENVGSQDQVCAAFGGFNRIDFSGEDIQIRPVVISEDRLKLLEKSLMLFFTGFSRTASQIAEAQIMEIPAKKAELTEMYHMVAEAVSILASRANLTEFGKLLDKDWMLKRSLSKEISNPYIDYVYEAAKKAGAEGGKVLGAGGGGFILLFVEPELQPKVRESVIGLFQVPFHFRKRGSQLILYEP